MTPDEAVVKLKRIGLDIQVRLPEMLSERLVTDVALSEQRVDERAGVTLKLTGPLLEMYLDLVHNDAPIIHQNQREFDAFLRSDASQFGYGANCFLDNERLPYALGVKLTLRHMQTADMKRLVFKNIIGHIPQGLTFGPAFRKHSDENNVAWVQGLNNDHVLEFGALWRGSHYEHGYRINGAEVHTPADVAAAFST
jgi:hypothetical protein